MGLASPAPPRPPTLARESPASSKLILGSSIPSMSQGFHQGSNIFSFSDEFHERPPQQQHRGREKLRPVQGFEDSPAVAGLSIAGNPLQSHAPMLVEEEDEDEEEEEEEEEEEVPRAYGAAPSTAGATNILSEMFNFPGAPADLLACHNSLPGGYQRLPQRPAAGFLSAADSWVPYATNRQGLLMGSSNTGNWGSLEDAAVAKQDGDMNPDSSSSMRLFFMDPQSAQETRQHHWHPNSPTEDQPGIGAAAVGPLHDHPQASHHSQAFLGAGSAAYGFGGGGETVIENQGLSLSLSSSLRQLEADQQLSRVREAAAGTLFFNSQLHHHDQAEHHDLIASGHPLQIIRQGQGQQQQQQLHMVMSYGGGGGCQGPVGFASAMNVLRNSKYARATQELLEEFCSVGRGGQYQLRSGHRSARVISVSNPNTSSGHGGGGGASTSAAAAVSSSSSKVDIPALPLSPADRFENQRKKSKLLSILEEVERRYNHYCEQMQMVVNSFDSVMGLGAATPYTALAQKAMSRHFRCLKDAVAAQLKHTCELLGEKDGTVSGSGLTKGETPRLRLIDQSLRQQRAFNQMGMMEQEAWRPQRGLPDRSVNLLRAWLFEHFLHPYPSDADKHLLARQTGLSRNQVSNWFINARVRLWKPMVEEMYQQEAKERDDDDDELEEPDLQYRNKSEEETANRRKMAAQQIPESHSAAENDPSSAPIPRSQPRQAADDAAAAVIFAPAPDDGIYGPAAAVLGPSPAAQLRFGGGAVAGSGRGSGDLSLTLGLRHAGGNAPDSGRFGKC